MINKETLVNREKWVLYFYWSLPLLLFILQALYTFNSMNQIRYEELAESVRNVFWLQNRTIYDGVSSNAGWYGTLLLVYNFFGFDLYTAKYFRLLLQLISLLCLATVLKKYLGVKLACVPLIVISLSPTLLFFNTLQTSYGTDLQYLPISIYLLSLLQFKNFWKTVFTQILAGLILMTAWMSYPTFVYYLPALFVFYIYQLSRHKFKNQISSLIFVISFLIPFIISLIYLKDKSLLLYDEVAKSGIFRGAGIFYFDGGNFFNNLFGNLSDLFIMGNSYYFEVAAPDFSHLFPILPLLIVFLISIFLTLKNHRFKFILILVWSVFLLNIFINNFTFDPSGRPGIRRSTPLLAAFYTLFAIIWYYLNSLKWETVSLKWTVLLILLFIPLHHLLVYPLNYGFLKTPSYYQYSHVFGMTETPQKTLSLLVEKIQVEDLQLSCQDQGGKLTYCRYSEVYPAVAGFCQWNGLNCHQVLGFDEKEEKFIPLSLQLWESYYFQH